MGTCGPDSYQQCRNIDIFIKKHIQFISWVQSWQTGCFESVLQVVYYSNSLATCIGHAAFETLVMLLLNPFYGQSTIVITFWCDLLSFDLELSQIELINTLCMLSFACYFTFTDCKIANLVTCSCESQHSALESLQIK